MATATRQPPRSGPPPIDPPEPARRRASAAGHVVVIAVVALVVGSLLNAEGLRKMAYTQPEGWRRDVGMAFTRPLVDISELLRLDQPRRALKSLLGREEDDRIATSVKLPPARLPAAAAGDGAGPATSGASATAATTTDRSDQKKPVFTPEHPLKLWIAGDSLAIVPGESLLRLVAGRPVEPVGEIDGRLATGLERPDRYDWFSRIPREMQKQDPDAVVLTFGANDFGGYMTGLPDGTAKSAFGTPSWMSEYRRRVAGVMDLVTGQSGRQRLLVWIGVPIVADKEREERYRLVNSIVRAEAERRAGRVAFVDTYRMFRSKSGGYVQRIRDADGHLVTVRSPDGLHFEPAGGDRVAKVVLQQIEKAYELRDEVSSTGSAPDLQPATP